MSDSLLQEVSSTSPATNADSPVLRKCISAQGSTFCALIISMRSLSVKSVEFQSMAGSLARGSDKELDAVLSRGWNGRSELGYCMQRHEVPDL